ncbi:aminoglycoside phosphotransferase (APT) family kinase protein [Salsuginibacillus halophilus]|uniref:Aminoglycoside phosphotransferase (APT) family kinase protein n=1 Tax=Salsuginibacillus halophilus TaxID=517424 RepID=A0A2P8HBM3_9BACI|nr:phosphotransferase family protein [Salsuginibacillus halophilus]PSL43612.1 aminoglycoside phosphotransferase (APT) family kinase protein [Salsuginibacillus halophilus]
MTASHDTSRVRPGEELPEQALKAFLQANFDLPDEPLEIRQFSAGHSNLTYEISAGSFEVVLRRPPFGPVAPKAHDMEREYEFLRRLHPAYPLAPEPYIFCEDENVIGRPFFLMERRRGVVVDTALPENVTEPQKTAEQMSASFVQRLVDLHKVSPEDCGLLEMTKPDGFMERQINGWLKRYKKAKTEEHHEEEFVMQWLIDHCPLDGAAAVIHYDYKLNNAMFNENLTEMTGLFDWEMATVGDPLADIGALLSYWVEADDPDWLKQAFGTPPVTVQPGFYTRRELVEAYARKSGRNVDDLHVYVAFGYFKLAVIAQQIYARYVAGQTDDQRFKHLNQTVGALFNRAASVIREGV